MKVRTVIRTAKKAAMLHAELPDIHSYPFSPDSCTRIVFIDLLILSLLFSNRVLVSPRAKLNIETFMARTCIQRNELYESAWDGRVLILVSYVTSKCGYRRSLYTDSSRIPTLH